MKIRILEVCVFCFVLALKTTAQTPIITSEPQSATNNIASAADFKVVATNTATYQWYFQGTQILTGQTNATLSLDDLSTNDAGSYTVVVTSSNNISVTSAPPAVLTIVPGTIIQWTIATYPGGGSSNFLVQLFDHDKPATVENFIHYITSGAYSNMFLDRDSTSFVLQGGDYVATDRSSTNLAVEKLVPGTNFPSQLDSEFGVGPLIHNTFGTLAMALVSGETNSATSAFYFNLVDNSATLDSQDFTVFGRILYGTNAGSNVLQYFNTLSAPTNGIYDYSSNSLSIATLPVNYNGTNAPTDANLFYCGFLFVSPTSPPVDTTPPTVSITFPAPDTFFTNFGTLTVQGTAEDNVGLAEVFCVLTASTGANGGLPQTNIALGAANWSLSLPALEPGVYQLTAYAEDGAGNLSAPVTEYFTNAANLPPGLAITNPAPGAVLQNTNALVAISGTLPSSTTVTQITVQLFSQSNAVTAMMNATTNGTSWSLNLSNLMNGVYTIVVLAEDSSGEEGLVTETFTAQFPPTIVSPPANLTILDGSLAEFSVTASNAASYQWQLDGTNVAGATNSTLFVADVSTNLSGSTYQVIITNTYGTITSAPVVLTVVTGTMVQITIAGFPNGSSSNVVVQLYDHEKPATVANFLHYITPARYGDIFQYGTYLPFTNMIWDRCFPGFILQGGDYDAPDQTNTIAPQNLESTLFSVYNDFTDNSIYIPRFAARVDNEFNVGPVIHNTFGTLAMATAPGEPDSAAGGFFFNLADNTNLDNENGGYTVFGRVISGSNVLQYFNTLSKPNEGIFDGTTVSTNTDLPNLPVNYKGWQEPADANLFFADFTLLSTFNADTNPPTVQVNSPANGQTVTNAVVMVQGTAGDNVAVANVASYCSGTNYSISVYTSGTTNWTANLGVLPPGPYTNIVIAQDGAGNTGKATNYFTVPYFPLVVSTNGKGTLSPNLTNTTLGNTYAITATAGKGEMFANWVLGTNSSIAPEVEFVLVNGTEATATFISNNVSGGVSVTFPGKSAQITSNSFSVKGKLASSLSAAQVNCRVYAYSNAYAVTTNMVINATNGIWSTPAVSLAPGTYVAQAFAQTAEGRGALVNQIFIVLAPLNLIINGRGGASIPNGTYLYSGSQYTQLAYPASGESFLSWNTGSGASASISYPFTMTPGLTFTLTFVSNSFPGKLTFTSPTANSQVTNSTFNLGGRIASPLAATQVVCQLFQNGAPLTGFMPATISPTNWMLPVSNLTMGIYNAVAIATDQSGKTTLASEQFSVNFYPNLAGNYKGLFFDPADLSPTNAGFLSLKVSSTTPTSTGKYGAVSGTLMLPARNYSFSINMTNTGTASVVPSGFDGSLALSFDVTNFSAQVSGSVTQGGQTSPLTAYRTLTKLSTTSVPSPGQYVLSLRPQTPTNEPPGDSFAAVTVSASGNLAVAGTLADNSSFSQSTGVFTNGVWPLYASFYKGQGILIGWETNQASGESAGTLYWIKNPRNGTYDTGGVDEQLNSVGTNYVRPAAGVSYRIIFGGGTVNPPVTNEFSFNTAGTIVTTNQLKGSVLASTGVLKGSFVNPSTHATIDFSGIFVSQIQGGGGFTLDADAQTGYFEFTPISGQ